MKNDTYQSKIKMDLISLLALNVVLFAIFMKVDFLETLYQTSLRYEHLELDEIIPLFFTIALSLAYFSSRRLIELKQLQSHLEKLANNDSLTGLYNRRYIKNAIHTELDRCKRTSSSLSIILLDIDNFKAVNDCHGHSVGDQVLIEFSRILCASTRNIDLVSRWGGEEFLIVCPETFLHGALGTANRLLRDIGQFEFDVISHCTASMGVVTARPDETFDNLLHRADTYLYAAKHKGKNCLVSN